MEGGIELDDIQVVEVTGTAHRDRQHRSRKKGCECNPSLRATTILIFVCIGIVYVIGVAIGNVLMFQSLETLDRGSSNTSINRLAMLIEDDIVKLQQLVRDYGFTYPAVAAVDAMVNNAPHAFDELYADPNDPSPLYTFMISFLNSTAVMDWSQGYPIPVLDEWNNSVVSFSTGSEINFWSFLDPNFEPLWTIFHPKNDVEAGYTGTFRQYPPPNIYGSVYRQVVNESGKPISGWIKMLVPNENVLEPMLFSFEPIISPFDMDAAGLTAQDLSKFTFDSQLPENLTIHGYLVGARSLFPRMKLFSDDVPSCITLQNGYNVTGEWDELDEEMFGKVVPGPFGTNKSYGGIPAFVKRDRQYLEGCKTRICPAVPLFNATSSLMTGYMTLCGLDPNKFEGEYKYQNASCIRMRLDRPMSMVDQGTIPVVSLSVEIIGMMIILCVIFVIFLDCVVLRRIVNLSNVIKKQTHGHAQALKDDDETTATMSVHEDKHREKRAKSGRSGKSGRSASGTSETTNSSDAGGGGAAHGTGRDEIGNLKRAMEQNALGLRKRLEAVNDSIKIEQQKTIRHKQAMQLLNLWCGRKDYFPGLRPNAMQLRYEPTRSLDDLLSNPLAIEYLKSHCESDRTLENLWFILDVSWLEELETAEDNEEDQGKRAQIHEVATCAAKTIMQRYIAVNAPQQINISDGNYKKLREKGDQYTRHMFDDAVSEVKLMLNTDILPRFQKSSAYSAMSETLFIDSSGDGDESEFSDETVSTAGSILTDEAEEGEGGVAHVFAHTFKNLHTAFEVGHDDNSSSYSGSSHHTTSNAAPSGSVVAGTVTSNTSKSGGKSGKAASKGDGSSVSDSDSDEPEPPKLEDEPKKKEEPKKEEEPKKKEELKKEEPKKEEPKKESAESSDSSDSSSGGISTDSMSESSAASTSTGSASSESD